MQGFDESRFRNQVDEALKQIRKVLENNRNPKYPSDVHHKYDDKYLLAEFLTNTSLAATLNCLEVLGLTEQKLARLLQWAKTRSVTLRLRSTEKCVFDHEEKKEVDSKNQHVTEYKGVINAVINSKSVTTVYEYFWTFTIEYSLVAFQGNNPDETVLFQGRTGETTIKTNAKVSPKPEVSVVPAQDLQITWLLNNLNEFMALKFSIDRSDKSCHTPRRNSEINQALSFYSSLLNWSRNIHSYFTGTVFPTQQAHGQDIGKIHANGVFVPVLPLFDPEASGSVKKLPSSTSDKKTALVVLLAGKDGPVLPISDITAFLDEQKRGLRERFAEFAKMFQDTKQLITAAEANLLGTLLHVNQLCQYYSDGVNYIEDLLRAQLVAAIGKEVGPADFKQYMRFHQRQLYKAEFQPRGFCYAIRRPEHYPEGTVSIEERGVNSVIPESITTTVKHFRAVKPMKIAISAVTKIAIKGERYLHSWVGYKFSGQPDPKLNLVARTRQFSSFIVVVGKIIGPHLFEPKAACLLQNKDELTIPLDLFTIPSAKEFKEAVESLSPEMRRFAKAYRSMQLASTLFGIAVIQIKPQLEKLMKIADDALTKEVQLTQDLMQLFIKYQIPSDLISFGGLPKELPVTKLSEVKRNVGEMQNMVKQAEDEELQAQKQKTTYAILEGTPKGRIVKPVSRNYSEGSESDGDEDEEDKEEEDDDDNGGDFDGAPIVRKSFAASAMPESAEGGAPGGAPVPAPAPAPAPAPTPAAKPEIQENPEYDEESLKVQQLAEEPDYTKVPAKLDKRVLNMDEDGALRPTIINVGTSWSKTSQETLLSPPVTRTLETPQQDAERLKAFELLDALSRSGALEFDHAELHVVLASTHCFDKTLMNTVIQDNVNPIEKVERSGLVVASTIHDKIPKKLIKPADRARVKTHNPKLFALPSNW